MVNHCPQESASTQATVQRLIFFYEHLSPELLSTLPEYYAHDAHFKDPFNDVQTVEAITQIFAHMFTTLEQPHFLVTQHLTQGNQAFLEWEFHFRMRRWRPAIDQCIRGATLVRFNAQGLVITHRDYWDTAEELYEKLPIIGPVMRWLRKAGSSSTIP